MKTARTHPVWPNVLAETASWWRDAPPQEPDVVVVGAGVAGLSTALQLARAGRDVCVLERRGIGSGETLRTSAHLASALDDRFTALARYHGEEGARQAAASHAAAIDWMADIAQAGNIDCDFHYVPAFLFSCHKRTDDLADEARAASQAGLHAVLQAEGLASLPALGPVIRFERQARVDIGSYLLALARRARDAGVVFVRADVIGITGGSRPEIACRNGTALRARAVVAATNVPVHETGATYLKQAAYRTYVVVGRAPKGSIPDALYWDDGDPYHYVRLRRPDEGDGTDVEILVGGGDHKTGQDDDPTVYARLQDWTRVHFPSVTRFTHAWSGQVLEPIDGLAFIGADPDNENVFLVTGDSGNGLTHGTVAAILLGELIAGRDHPWAALYAPGRHRLKSAPTWLRENANAALQYRDWLAPSHEQALAVLPRGSGVVVRRGMHRVAVYRAGDGALNAHNARCTHLGCVVRWSSEEKSWDCPCHGSRFDAATGAVLNGPASEPLEPFDLHGNDARDADIP
ncbi:FAD-dependent oxidoreductase [Pseudoxanthomonas mexicana]|uniref:FAD-dependent oxidoreductase n=1 Tax=Pseudoxanthomonas mexicana TaxID=128785 RepID=UPI00209FA984|nr:FAD-dependent oxidoreductase [Pseudoxanthomonas mexicana]MCP1582040.1 glycine/D-amino acid oxidase-like deaminating enzyme/nitrite reductase/ring-hydroxylating ferredoxin subunit [Pseudoxanthomonas mexicana]